MYLSCIQFADNTTLYGSSKSLRLLQCEIKHDLAIITDWFRANKLTLNAEKTICVIFSPKNELSEEIKLNLGGHIIPCRTETKFLGVWIDKNLDWKKQTDVLLIKLRQNVGLFKKSKNILDKNALRSVYYVHIHSHLSYAISVWGSMSSMKQIQKLQKVQNICLTIMEPSRNITEAFKKLKILKINQLVQLELNKLAYKLAHNLLPIKLAQCMNCDASGKSLEKQHHYLTRNKHIPNLPQVSMKMYQKNFLLKSISLYSVLPKEITSCQNLNNFLQSVKQSMQTAQ